MSLMPRKTPCLHCGHDPRAEAELIANLRAAALSAPQERRDTTPPELVRLGPDAYHGPERRAAPQGDPIPKGRQEPDAESNAKSRLTGATDARETARVMTREPSRPVLPAGADLISREQAVMVLEKQRDAILDAYDGTDAAMKELGRIRYETLDAAVSALRALPAATQGWVVWKPIDTAPKNPVGISPQSGWFHGRQHGPVILLSFLGAEDGQPGYEQWGTHIGWWEPHTDCKWCQGHGVDGCWRFLEDDGGHDVQPTYWMHLPQPPAAQPAEKDAS